MSACVGEEGELLGHRPAGSTAASAGGAGGALSLVPGAGTEGTSPIAERMWAASAEASATQWERHEWNLPRDRLQWGRLKPTRTTTAKCYLKCQLNPTLLESKYQ